MRPATTARLAAVAASPSRRCGRVALRAEGGIDVEVADFGAFSRAAAAGWPASTASACYELTPTDESLESVFAYLVGRLSR